MDTQNKRYGLLGRTLGHSYSPLIHHSLGNPAYTIFEREPEELAGFLAEEDIGGLNVTIPYKKTVLPYCAAVSDNVREIGAANTLVKRDGKLYAYNTDKTGFEHLVRSSGIAVSGADVLVLGSGGASLAVKAALHSLGAGSVTTISRSGPDNYDNISRHFNADVIVNTTPVGMYPNVLVSPLSLEGFQHLSGVFDIVYNPCRTAFLMDAEQRGIPFAGGLEMLAAQAVASHRLFFGSASGGAAPSETLGAEDNRLIADIRKKLDCQAENIILIGMPGCGKSYVAYALNKLCGKPVVDIDTEIERTAGRSIPEIFAQDGEPAFRQLERSEIRKWGAKSGQILSLGGGAVLDDRNYAPLHQNGRIYLLRRDLDKLAMKGRPLSTDRARLQQMEMERRPRYLFFRDAEIDNNGTVDQTAASVWKHFQTADFG